MQLVKIVSTYTRIGLLPFYSRDNALCIFTNERKYTGILSGEMRILKYRDNMQTFDLWDIFD